MLLMDLVSDGGGYLVYIGMVCGRKPWPCPLGGAIKFTWAIDESESVKRSYPSVQLE